MSLYQIGVEFGVDHKVIKRILVENNIDIRGMRDALLKHYINGKYFEVVDTEQKAYWLGFIAADGCIDSNERSLRLDLSTKDRGHIEKFLEATESNYKTREYYTKQKSGRYTPMDRLLVSSPELCSNLIRHGVTPRKSSTLRFPNIPQHLERHFVRGIFDGNGCVSGDSVRMCVCLCGTFDIVEKSKQIIAENSKAKINFPIKGNDFFCTTKIGGRNQVMAAYHIFYDDATVFLDRKKRKFESILKITGENYESIET